MAGSSDWWEKDTIEDGLLLKLIEEVEQLGRLPAEGKGLADEKRPNPYITYFGSTAEAYRKVAEILYGNSRLTAPDDLLPRERELSEDEQAKILLARRETYLKRLQELKTPGTLNRWRSEASRRRLDKELADRRRLSPNLTKPKRKRRKKKVSKETVKNERLDASKIMEMTRARDDSEVLQAEQLLRKIFQRGVEAKLQQDQEQGAEQIQKSQRGLKDSKSQKNVEEVTKKMANRAKWNEEQLLEMLYNICRHYGGSIPSTTQFQDYLYTHTERNMPCFETFRTRLGKRATWRQRVNEYALAHGLEPIGGGADLTEEGSDEGAAKHDDASAQPERRVVSGSEAELGGDEASKQPESCVRPELGSESEGLPNGTSVQPELENASSKTCPEVGSGMDGTPNQTKSEEGSEPELEKTQTEGATEEEKSVIRINLTGMTFRFQINGQDYEVTVGPGATGEMKNTS